MNQTQPAISAALRRLREVLGDPILVRERGGMVPTERARQLRDRARTALAEIAHIASWPRGVRPRHQRADLQLLCPAIVSMASAECA